MDETRIYFEGNRATLQQAAVEIEQNKRITVELVGVKEDDGEIYYNILINGHCWLATPGIEYAIITYSIMRDNIANYIEYIHEES